MSASGPTADAWIARIGEDIIPPGPCWLSNGTQVWYVEITGHPAQLADARQVKFWQPAHRPAPPQAHAA